MPKNSVKKRNWAFVAYPESLPDDWLHTLQQTGLQVAVSPKHDRDTDPDGNPKKPHYHVILCYSGPTTYGVVAALTASINGTVPQPLEQVRGYYRYFTHKDNPEKFQYDENEIVCINGFSIRDFVELTKSEVLAILSRLQNLIREQNILEYSDFCDLLLDSSMTDEYDVATSHTYFFEKYISSRRYKQEKAAGEQPRSVAEARARAKGDK